MLALTLSAAAASTGASAAVIDFGDGPTSGARVVTSIFEISGFSGNTAVFQGFTVPVANTDNLLESFSFAIDDDLQSGGTLHSVAGYVLSLTRPAGSASATATVLNTEVPVVSAPTAQNSYTDVDFDFTTPIVLVPGQEYAVLVTGLVPGNGQWQDSVAKLNAGDQTADAAWATRSGGLALTSADLAPGSTFSAAGSATDVHEISLTLVPEPASGVLLGAGGLLMSARRRKV
ncbi:hypothetical protein PSMK_19350 [Phycisphaera mikurensis NBRC 102666]|uniref:PEP-CTERM protein-sorting domain-containing protein n=1 Tax=Phycisphaera mikurensis (strain NBRC 102666 / KCTC 22515 / FYK2301M01) TaxID=1142394 RepID=I0IFQ6_PHYMF|nr:hypothetical protein PSMK_19350 [Phycisphaera mikurensis NBRC 102666]